MLKKTLVGIVVCLGLAGSAAAQESSELKVGMDALSGSVSALQMGFFTNDKKISLDAIAMLKKNVEKYLGNKATITKLLPEDEKYKASIAVNSAQMIEKYAAQIEKELSDKNMSAINREMSTQKAFLDIQNQCFRCHNLVRDWQ